MAQLGCLTLHRAPRCQLCPVKRRMPDLQQLLLSLPSNSACPRCPSCCAAQGAFYYSHGSTNNTFIIATSSKNLPIALGALSAADTTYIFGSVPKTFDDAEAYCAAHGGHLASWGASAEQKAVEDYFAKTTGYMMQGYFSFYWFGLRVSAPQPAC